MATPTNITRNYLNQIGDQPTTAESLFLTFNADTPDGVVFFVLLHIELRMILESSRCTVYMLNQILSAKTVDVGKQSDI